MHCYSSKLNNHHQECERGDGIHTATRGTAGLEQVEKPQKKALSSLQSGRDVMKIEISSTVAEGRDKNKKKFMHRLHKEGKGTVLIY